MPYGELLVDEHSSSEELPYKFNGKQFDEETGLYYYGARYYEPRLGLWMSVDPISNYDPRNDDNYLDGEHNGGVYNSFNLYPYEYCYQNPILLVDYTGKQANSSVLLARNPSGDYNFTPAASHLLHLVSKVNEYQILVATVRFEETGILKGSVGTAGSSLTAGKDPDYAVITHFYKNMKNNMTYKETNGKFFYEFFNRNAHEVGHIPQVNGTQHLVSSLGQYLKNVISGENWHDGRYSTKEHDADKGAQEFQKFNKFIDNKIQKNGLKNLFYNKKNSQDKIIETIDKWLNLYERSNHNKGNE